jgi:3-mercaptopyruvate sulfurtransferase SseA
MALLAKGYTNVRVLVNGWTLWQEKRLPVETNDDSPNR